MTCTRPPLSFDLLPFAPPSGAARGLFAQFAVTDGTAWVFYRVSGDWQALDLAPAQSRPGFVDMLWQHTCFEFFLAVEGRRRYLEFNFSPGGDYAHYLFDDYRRRAPGDPASFPFAAAVFRNAQDTATLGLQASFSWHTAAQLLGAGADASFLINIAAVTQEPGGAVTHWALRHPVPKADFHLRDGFVAT